jgi:hypothetical protein
LLLAVVVGVLEQQTVAAVVVVQEVFVPAFSPLLQVLIQ